MKIPSPEKQYQIDLVNTQKWAEAYFKGTPMVTDSIWDATIIRMRAFEKNNPILKSDDSATEAVGCDITVTALTKQTRKNKMYSMDNGFNTEDISRFIANTKASSYVAEPKYDGLAIELIYKQGNLISATTRGDGVTGEVVTHTISTIKNVPKQLTKPKNVTVRGEVVVPHAVFNSAQGEYKSPRNMAAGLIRTLDASKTARYGLKFFPYEAIGLTNKDHTDDMFELTGLGFENTQKFIVNAVGREIDFLEEFYNSAVERRKNYGFDLDGLVIKVNSKTDQVRLGYTAKTPRWAIAWKFPTESSETTISEIIPQVGRTGQITPKAVFAPAVIIEGVMVSQATLHNYGECFRKGYGEGAFVAVTRNGGVVPGIKATLKPAPKVAVPPEVCPSCGTKLKKTADLTEVWCPADTGCKDKSIAQIKHMVSRNCLDIRGMGDAMVKFLVETNGITSFATFLNSAYWTAEKQEALEKAFGIPAKKVNVAVQSLFTDGIPWDKLIFSLGIPNVGETTAKDLAKYFTPNAFGQIDASSLGSIAAIPNIGPKTAKDIVDFVRSNLNDLKSIFRMIPTYHAQPEKSRDVLGGSSFVVTGKFGISRDDLKNLILNNGGKLSSGISNKTDFLVLGEGTENKSKATKAKELGVEIITLEDLMKKIEGDDGEADLRL